MNLQVRCLFIVALFDFSGCFTSELADAPTQHYWEPSRTSFRELEEMYRGTTVTVTLIDDQVIQGPLYLATSDSIVLCDSIRGFHWSAPTRTIASVKHFNHLIPCIVTACVGGAFGAFVARFSGSESGGMHPESARPNEVFAGAVLGTLAGAVVGLPLPVVYEYEVMLSSHQQKGMSETAPR